MLPRKRQRSEFYDIESCYQGIQHTDSFLVSSSPLHGASNVTNNGASFEVLLETPIAIPSSAKTCGLQVLRSTYWWTTPNISAALGNNLFPLKVAGVAYDLTIPDGLYSLETLAAALDRQIENTLHKSGIILLEPDYATQKVNISLVDPDLLVDFDRDVLDPDYHDFRLGHILGWYGQHVGTSVAGALPLNGEGAQDAAFNTIEYFLLHSDLVSRGIRVNNDYSSIIAQLPIEGEAGSQQIYEPAQPVLIDAHELIGHERQLIRFNITDQNNNLIDTRNEQYSMMIQIIWTE